jgi:hypothetical protein
VELGKNRYGIYEVTQEQLKLARDIGEHGVRVKESEADLPRQRWARSLETDERDGQSF